MSVYEYKWSIIAVIFLIGSQILINNYSNIDYYSMGIGLAIGFIFMGLCELDWWQITKR